MTASIMLAVLAYACAEPKSSPVMGYERGSEDFKAFLRVGFGANHTSIPQAGSALNLAGNERGVYSLAMDPAADIWSSVLFDVSLSPLIRADQSLLDWSREYIAGRKAELGLDVSELVSFGNSLYEPFPDQTYVTFQRQYQGREVRGAFVQLIFARNEEGYRLREILNSSYGPINLRGGGSASNAQTAIDATGIPSLAVEGHKALIFPQIGADGHYEFRYATQWDLADGDEEKFQVILDDDSQTILAARSNHFHVKQTLQLETFKNSYVNKTLVVEPFAGVRVDTVNADASGVIDTAATTSTITLSGAKGAIINLTGNQNNTTVYSFPVTYAAGGTTKVASTATIDAASLNAYAALLEVNEWVARFLTPQQAPLLSTGIPVRVNMIGPQGNEFCNAFYQTGSLNFFAQGTLGNVTCANTALIKDVMYHEWGHALDDQVGVQPGIIDGAFSEGIGDINATLATGDPVVGRGFFLNDAASQVRNVQNNRVYPPANQQEAEVHSAGQIIGGAFWDLRQNLVALYGPVEGTNRAGKLFFTHMLVTDRYIDSYASLLRLDDNDNNAATPSPSYCAINKAFGKHRLIGAATLEGASCVDTDQGLKVRVDVDNGGGSLKLLASSFAADSVVMCEGKVATCPAAATTVNFTKSSSTLVASDTKKFYEGSATVTVKAGTSYTLISRDVTGATLGTKVLTFGSRDTSADLSKTLK